MPASADTDLTAQITAVINDFRVAQGLASLPAYDTDVEVRRAHEQLVSTGEMHTQFDESAAFYLDRGASNFGEVEAYVEGADCSADALLQQWVASDFHRDLLLTPDAAHLVAAATCDAVGAWGTGHVITTPGTSSEPAVSEQESGETKTAAPTGTDPVSTSDDAATMEPAEATQPGSSAELPADASAATVGDGIVSSTADTEVLAPSLGHGGGFDLRRTDYWEVAPTRRSPAGPAVDKTTRSSTLPEQADPLLALSAAAPTTAVVVSASPPPSAAFTALVAGMFTPPLAVVLLVRRRRKADVKVSWNPHAPDG
jgi:hypothetical protein